MNVDSEILLRRIDAILAIEDLDEKEQLEQAECGIVLNALVGAGLATNTLEHLEIHFKHPDDVRLPGGSSDESVEEITKLARENLGDDVVNRLNLRLKVEKVWNFRG